MAEKPTPFLITVFNNATSDADVWTNIRLFYIRPNKYAPGTEKSGAPATFSGARVGKWAVVVLTGLLLWVVN